MGRLHAVARFLMDRTFVRVVVGAALSQRNDVVDHIRARKAADVTDVVMACENPFRGPLLLPARLPDTGTTGRTGERFRPVQRAARLVR